MNVAMISPATLPIRDKDRLLSNLSNCSKECYTLKAILRQMSLPARAFMLSQSIDRAICIESKITPSAFIRRDREIIEITPIGCGGNLSLRGIDDDVHSPGEAAEITEGERLLFSLVSEAR
jgi:hypothetical protein